MIFRKKLHFVFLLYGINWGLFFLFFFFQLFLKVAFSLTVHFGLVFVYAKDFGYVIFVNEVIGINNNSTEGLQQEY